MEGEPQSRSQILDFMDETRRMLAEKVHAWLAERHVANAENSLDLERYPYGATRSGSTQDNFDALRNAASFPPWGGERGVHFGEWEKYLQEAEKLRKSVRLEDVKSYLALRKARTEAVTSEEKEKLQQLFKRQNEIRRLLHSPEYADHLGRLRQSVREDIGIAQQEMGKIGPEVAAQVSESVGGKYDAETLAFMANWAADFQRQQCADRISSYQQILENLDRFEQARGEQAKAA